MLVLRRVLSSALLAAVVFVYATAVEGAAFDTGEHTLTGGTSQPAVCHNGRSDGTLLQSTGPRKGPGMAALAVLGISGATASPASPGWMPSEQIWPQLVLRGRVSSGEQNARGPPHHDR